MDTKKLKLESTPESLAALVAERCYKDAAFRQDFLANPKGVVEKILGESLPADAEVVACRNDDKRWYIPMPSLEGATQLNEKELEAISAGSVARYPGAMRVCGVGSLSCFADCLPRYNVAVGCIPPGTPD